MTEVHSLPLSSPGDLCKLLGIKQNITTAYHPQTDGQTERVNQDLEQFLRIFVNHHQSDWAEGLPLLSLATTTRSTLLLVTLRSSLTLDNILGKELSPEVLCALRVPKSLQTT